MNAKLVCAVGLGLSALAAAVRAQSGDGLPTEYVVLVPPGAWIDLDTGQLLPQQAVRPHRADLRFSRDGAGFYLEPLFGGARAAASETEPPAEMPKDRVRIARRDGDALVMFARTDRGVARIELMVADPYSTASASLRWVVVPPKKPVFLPAPKDLAASWQEAKLVVTWSGDAPRWLVEVHTGEATQHRTVERREAAFEGLAPDARHRVVVRGMYEGGVISMPADVVQFGARQQPRTGVVDYAERWYDRSGGLSLTSGAEATDGDVVFYLYGVFVPGGGVTKVGSGEREFAALHELPAGPFPQSYGRLDENDVLVVRTADGRFAKLWLAADRGDVRSGMHVHFVFLPDGRRTLLAPPRDVEVARTAAGPRVSWKAPPGAVRYRVSVAGAALADEPTEPSIVLQKLPAQRVHEVAIAAISDDGEVSGPARAIVHTFGDDVRVGTCTITAQRGGFDFARGQAAAGGQAPDLAITGGAGGASTLHFAGAGIAPGGEFAFGEFPALDRLTFKDKWSSDDRHDGTDRFYVRTPDGGLASVRIVKRDWPTSELEYVWVPKR